MHQVFLSDIVRSPLGRLGAAGGSCVRVVRWALALCAAAAVVATGAKAAGAPQTTLHEWTFGSGTLEGWQPARHLTVAEVRDGIVHGTIAGHDPQMISPPLELPATPYQEVWVRLRSGRNGRGELFYTNTFEGEFRGFSGQWVCSYTYTGDGEWQEVRIRPFWQALGTIRQIRFDPPGSDACEIDWIRIVSRVAGQPVTATAWEMDGDMETLPGWVQAEDGFLESPPLAIPLGTLPWVHLDIAAPTEGHVTLVWGTAAGPPGEAESFLPRYGGRHTAGMDLGAHSAWKGTLVHLAVRVTCQDGHPGHLRALRLAAEPPGKADVRVLYFGPEDAINRVGRPAGFLLRLHNPGTACSRVRLTGLGREPAAVGADDLRAGIDLETDLPWTGLLTVVPTQPGPLKLEIALDVDGAVRRIASEPMTVLPPAPALPLGAIPPPRPAATPYRIATYYYPGFGSPYQWRQLERSAPWAKPALGYYDEGNPECVDWQIKWAVEHGISIFLVDWYWVAGRTRHVHYLDALRQARFREHLQWAVMWANHNPPKTHSEEDWRNVVRFWIDTYFADPQYLRIGGSPAVFIWAPHSIRADVGGSAAAARLAEIAQEMTRAAGLPGLTLVAMRRTAEEDLRSEGYAAVTSYHWWSDSLQLAPNPRYLPYSMVVERSRSGWDATERHLQAAGLGFIPVVDTGWDARPRHGSRTMVIYGRSPGLFRRSLADAKEWLDARGQNMLILGPANEWTEGSTIEPCTEYGFDMYRAVHDVFCEGPAPEIVGPAEVGLGPYDFDLAEPGARRLEWTFAEDGNAHGWRVFMGMEDLRVADGALTARTTTRDPAFMSGRLELRTADVAAIEIALQVDPAPPEGDELVVFWGTETSPIHSRAYNRVLLRNDSGTHTYRIELAGHGAWRGLLRELRLDPCRSADRTVRVRSIRPESPRGVVPI